MPALVFLGLSTVLLAVGLQAALQARDGERRTLHPGVQRILTTVEFDKVHYEAVRHLYAGTLSGRHEAWMEVVTSRQGPQFEFQVLEEHGAGRTRSRVLRGVLENEARGASEAGTLSERYYEFVPEEGANGRIERLVLKARHKDTRLVNGVLTIGKDGHPVELEGQLARSPSFWVRSVTIRTTYARFGDVSLPVTVETLADVRLFGQSTFSMQYRYMSVNGQRVESSAPAATRGPSPRLVALHEALSR